MSFIIRYSVVALTLFGTVFGASAVHAQVAVPTYHYDSFRTGWNNHETILTASNFPSAFTTLHTVALDDEVDTQPLLVPGLTIAGGTHDVVYVATASNTVYAIDASTGAILLSRNLGSPVPMPLGCFQNGPNVGINGTPTIDLAAKKLYVIAYVNGSSPTYQLHALNLSDLTDVTGSPVTVAASHTLTNGAVYTFNATVQRQRPGLLEVNGTIYAAFGSFCDYPANLSRGWLLAWNASTLAPLSTNRLTDSQGSSPTNWYLSSIWMSGYGIAGSGSGTSTRVMFSTGNSDCNFSVSPPQCPSKSTYDGVTNIQESIVKTGSDPANLLGIFTPSDYATLDANDGDLGSGGVLMLPTQAGNVPYMAVGAGKEGNLYLLDRLNMGKPLDTHWVGNCWCGPSYFMGPDGVGRVVTSHGNTVSTWQLVVSPSPHLVQEGTANITTGQDAGFFTVVSSNGTTAGTGIIWAVGRPSGTSTSVNLFAFAATASGGTYNLLYSAAAGSWPNTNGNANIVPVVANGKVYVASNKLLTIFGVPSGAAAAPLVAQTSAPTAQSSPPVASLNSPHVVTGILTNIDGSTLTLQTRSGKTAKVDDSQAARNGRVGALKIGEPFTALGESLTATGAVLATSIARAKGASGDQWPPDH